MKKIILILIMGFFLQINVSCSKPETTPIDNTDYIVPDWKCGTHNGNQLWTGPKGGCYYYNSNGNKTYVERSECNNC